MRQSDGETPWSFARKVRSTWRIARGIRATAILLTIVASGVRTKAATELRHFLPTGAQQGTSVEVIATGNFDSPPTRVWIDRPGVTLELLTDAEGQSKTIRKLEATIDDDAAPGVYWIRLIGESDASPPCPFIVGHLPDLLEAEPNDRWEEPQVLASPHSTVVHGTLTPRNDVDIYAVKLNAGQTLTAVVTAHETLDSPVDCVLQIVSAAGTVLQQNDDCRGLDPQVVFAAPATGTYLVRVFGFPAAPNSTIGLDGGRDHIYRLLLSTGPFADCSRPLAIRRDHTTPFQVSGWNLPGGESNVALEHPGDAHAVLGFDIPWGHGPVWTITDHTSVSESDGEQEITLPVVVTGCIESRKEIDAYAFHATKGTIAAFRVRSRVLGLPLDPVLELFDTDGKSIARVDDVGGDRDAEIIHTLPADGTYRLAVSDLHQQGGSRYAYRLECETQSPDFGLQVAAHQVTITAGGEAKLELTIERRHGFAGEIHFSVEGLPPDVTATAPVSPAEGDAAAKVELTWSAVADAAIASAPVRIVGTATQGETEMRRIATAAIPRRTATTSDVWLTVTSASGD